MSHRPTLAILALVLSFAAAACGGGTDATAESPASEEATAAADGLVVVTATNILADLTARLVGDHGTVTALMPVGADPHSFQLSSAQGQQLRDADIVVANGLGLEEGMLDALESAAEEGVEVVSLAETVTTPEEDQTEEEGHAEEEDHAEEGHEHDHADGDPHFWMDPVRVAEAIEDLALHLAEVDDNATEEEWAARAEVLVAELHALDEEVEEILSVVADDRRVLVTNHDSYDYFADAYDFEVLGTVIPGGGTLAEPSAADLEILVEDIRDAGVTAIFTETTDPSRLAEVVAEEVGEEIAVVQLVGGSLTDADGPAATYADYMRHNATLIADALG
ncbi:metal ABC transporter substrate-binding protein [Euzebya pacifica]|uniref:metal ABC transporter substrate-binding protein n=1 Tax=Euzebya pacifica TaxID=1608957 RepID=UPI0030FB55F0